MIRIRCGKKIFIFSILIVLGFQIRRLYSCLQTSDSYEIYVDNLFSKELQQDIKLFINTQLSNKNFQESYRTLVENFPMIDNVSIRRKNHRKLQVNVFCTSPEFNINNKLVLANNNKLFPYECYNNNTLNSLPLIQIQSNSVLNVSDYCKEFLNQLSAYVLDSYNVMWKNENKIVLTKKNVPSYEILITCNNIPSNKTLNACKSIIKKARESEKIGNKKLLADLRFANQIVLSFI